MRTPGLKAVFRSLRAADIDVRYSCTTASDRTPLVIDPPTYAGAGNMVKLLPR